MSRYNVLVLVLLCTIARIYSICPEVSFPGDASCKTKVEDDTLTSGDRVLFDNQAYQSSPWTTEFADADTVVCGNTVLMCSFGTGRSRAYFPELDVSSVSNFAVNISGKDFFFITPNPVLELCVKYSSQSLQVNTVGTTCYQVTSNTPKKLSVPSGMNYAYLVMQQPIPSPISGFCVNVERVTVKYQVCPCKEENLVQFPETGKGGDATVRGQCVENANTTDNLAINTTTCSSQVKGVRCYCNSGYEQSGSTCKACEENKFSTGQGASCQPCPSNTESGVASGSCECMDDHYRTTSQGECFSVPSAPRDLVQVAKSAYSFTLTWMCPETGDWDHLYYTVCHELESPDSEPVCMDVSQGEQCLNQYTMTGLDPFTSYELSVTSHNHISNLEEDREATITITAKTDEGVPGPPILKRLCTVVIWKPPVEPRGVLKFFELRFVDASGQEEMHIYDSTENFHLTSDIQMTQNVGVQLRVNNSRAYSQWVPSQPEPIGCEPDTSTCPPVPECNCPTVAEVVPTTEVVTPTMKPETTIAEPLATTKEPLATTEEPVSTTEEPVSTTKEPVSTTEEPVSTTEEPVSTTEEPVSTTEEPVSTTEEPVSTTKEPITTTMEPEPTTPPTSTACSAYPVCSGGVTIEHNDDDITSVNADDIDGGNGNGDGAVMCCTDYTQCCQSQKEGEMTYPNGTYVGRKSNKEPYFRNRRDNCVRLNAQASSLTAPLGIYGCVIPDNVGTTCCMPFTIQ